MATPRGSAIGPSCGTGGDAYTDGIASCDFIRRLALSFCADELQIDGLASYLLQSRWKDDARKTRKNSAIMLAPFVHPSMQCAKVDHICVCGEATRFEYNEVV
ncbi:hypothetical protein BC567DRAFT_71019 [Phyllosticta citribraziliensis]